MPIEDESWSYATLTDKDKRDTLEKKFKDDGAEKFNVTSSSFVIFTDKKLESLDEMNKNWKIHLSVDNNDISEAWRIAFPLLREKAQIFKVANMDRVKDGVKRLQKNLEETKKGKADFLKKHNKTDLSDKEKEELQGIGSVLTKGGRSVWEPEWEKGTESFVSFLSEKYDERIKEAEALVTEAQRMVDGMQITLYTHRY
jgi:hypothetical protein